MNKNALRPLASVFNSLDVTFSSCNIPLARNKTFCIGFVEFSSAFCEVENTLLKQVHPYITS